MIENFSTIIQQDFVQMIDFARGKQRPNDDQKIRIAFAAGKMLATVGMAFAAIFALAALKTFVVSSVVGAAFLGAIAVGSYAVNHDLFVICQNGTEQMAPTKAVAAGLKSIGQDFLDFIGGQKNTDNAPRNPATDGTFLRPLWDAAFAEIAARG